jgi:hypothetical protein
MALDVPDGGVFVAALGMAGDASATASWGTLAPAYSRVLVEGTPDLFSGVCAGPFTPGGSRTVAISTVGVGLNFRAVGAEGVALRSRLALYALRRRLDRALGRVATAAHAAQGWI